MKTIEISTSQNVFITYRLAHPLMRLLAFVIDNTIIGFSLIILSLLIGDILFEYYIFLPFVFYSLLFESLLKGASPGKMILGLRVVSNDGRELEFTDYLMRWMFRSIDTYGTICALGTFTMISSEKNQRTGDFLANTVVVSLKNKNRLTFTRKVAVGHSSDYEVKYPQAALLNKDEIDLITDVMNRFRNNPNEAHALALEVTTDQIGERLRIEKPESRMALLRGLVRDYTILNS